MVVAIVIPDLDGTATRRFASGLERAHWVVSRHVMKYAGVGDSVDDSCVILTATHSSCAPTVEPIKLNMPPKREPKPLGAYIHEPFNRSQYAVCYGRHDAAFNSEETRQMVCSDPQLYETIIGTGVKPE